MPATSTGPALLPWTEDDQANRLLAEDPNALLIGFALDQQVTVQKAFAGPMVLKQRLGHLDPARIAAMPPDELEAVFRDRPAIHRFPGAMAERVQSLCRYLADTYDGDGSRVWSEATSGQDMAKRIGALPGFGDMKLLSLSAVLWKRLGVEAARPLAPDFPTLGDVDSVEALHEYQAAKRAHKAARRAQVSSS